MFKYKILKDAKDRGGLGLPDFKLYFAANCLVWMKDRVLLRNRRILELKGCNLRFNWHGCLWNNKIKFKVDFKNHYVRNAILRIWNKYKSRLCLKMPLLVLPLEAFYKRETGEREMRDISELLIQKDGEFKFKSREGYCFQWFPYI